jgi:hypothetical protein
MPSRADKEVVGALRNFVMKVQNPRVQGNRKPPSGGFAVPGAALLPIGNYVHLFRNSLFFATWENT